jgi:hypothetical protein
MAGTLMYIEQVFKTKCVKQKSLKPVNEMCVRQANRFQTSVRQASA